MPTQNIVEQKYEGVYRACALLARNVVDRQDVTAEERYAFLKRAIPAVWHATIHMTNPLKSDQALTNCIAAYENATCQLITPSSQTEMTIGQAEVWIAHFISQTLGKIDFDAAIELGSGWGHRLINLWHTQKRLGKSYYACELSNNGIECTKTTQTLFPEMDLTAHQFNMLVPDFSFIPNKVKNPLIYTVHAIEQIPELPAALLDAILDTFPRATVVHFEPITFQLPKQNEMDVDRYTHDLKRSALLNQNMNLFDVISNNDRIEITQQDPAVWQVEGRQSVSMIKWRKRVNRA